MPYKYEVIPGMPEWFKPGIVCRVRNCGDWLSPRAMIGYSPSHRDFIDIQNCHWDYADPVEVWEPVEGEWVAWFNQVRCADEGFSVSRYCKGMTGYSIARISHLLISDLPATVEELLKLPGVEWR